MHRALAEKRTKIKELQNEKRAIVTNLRTGRQRKKEIDAAIDQLRQDIRHIQGRGRSW